MSVKELREQAARIATNARSKLDEIKADTPAERAAEIEREFDAMMVDHDAIQARADRYAKAEDAEARANARDPNAPRGENSEGRGAETGETISYRHAFQELFKVGGDVDALSGEARAALNEQRQQLKGTNTAGGYTAPVELANVLVESMKAYGPMYDATFVTELVTSNGNQIQIPTIDDTTKTGAIHTEGADIADDGSQDAVFAQKLLDAYIYDTEFVKFSLELAQDSLFNFETLLGRLLGTRLGRLANAALTTGTGSGQPNGIVTASNVGVTAAGTTAVTADEIIDLIHSVDPAYRASNSTAFMLSDPIVKAVRKLKDGQGNYLWQLGNYQAGVPANLLGYNVVVNQDMSQAMTTGQKIMLFGDFSKYIVRKVGAPTIGVMKERFWPNTGVAGLIRFDGELTDTAAVKHLKLA